MAHIKMWLNIPRIGFLIGLITSLFCILQADVENLPDDLNGQDISDIWLGESRARNQPIFWKKNAERSTPVMLKGDWKLHLPLVKNRDEPELYNIAIDPSEKNNLANAESDIFREMRDDLLAWNSELPDSYIKNKKPKKR